MCLYNYSYLSNLNNLTDVEYDLLNKIYKHINLNDTDTVNTLTEQLINLQEDPDKISLLKNNLM